MNKNCESCYWSGGNTPDAIKIRCLYQSVTFVKRTDSCKNFKPNKSMVQSQQIE